MRMNSFIGKKILSIIRDGNYAHPGEEEAIELTFKNVPKDHNRLMLDVGCGRGGTAHYLNINGWGEVTGIDIDSNSLEFAKKQYDSLKFIAGNVIDVSRYVDCQFDLFYLFNSFYAFDDQYAALESLRQISKTSASLLIFDYLDYGNYSKNAIMQGDSPFLPHPIKSNDLPKNLQKAGWVLISMTDISKEYEKWYSQFMNKVNLKRKEIIEIGGDDALNTVYRLYGGLLETIQRGVLGGVIVEAKLSV